MPRAGPSNTKPYEDSATENSDDEEQPILKKPAMPIACTPAPVDKRGVDHSAPGPELAREAQHTAKKSAASDSSPTSARPPPSKRVKQAASSSSDSDESDKVVAGPSTRRGARQPIKRGGRRF